MNLDEHQRGAVAAVVAGGHHVVLGAPGTGVTTTALAAFQEWAVGHRAESAVLLVPTRQRAALLRDALSARLERTTGSVLVRTPASLAYAILRLRASHRGEPAPTLIAGPEQDAILEELIAGHLAGDGVPMQWPDRISEQTLRLPAFRAELRDLLMRAAEAGLDGAGLARLGEVEGRAEWCAAGQLLTEYSDVMALGELPNDRGARYDAATIVDQAVVALQTWPELVGEDTAPRWSLVLHDDYQDATLATARLLGALADGGAGVAVFGDPDRGVQAFRGGQPSLLDTATRTGVSGGLGAQVHVLGTSHRHGPVLREAVRRLTASLPLLGDDQRRHAAPEVRAEPSSGAGCGARAADGGQSPLPPVRHLLLPTAAQEVAAIARELRIAHLRHRVPWSQMAVIVRTGGRVGEVRRGLRTAGVPLAAATPDRPLREEPAVRPLLVALRCVVAGTVDAESASALLLSPLGGLDAVSLRALRRALRQHHGGDQSSDQALLALLNPEVDAVGAADVLVTQPRLRAAVQRLQGVLAAGRAALATDARATDMVLWAMWDAAELASTWQQRALAGGPAADRADADLDAVVSLFAAAEQFADRTAGASPETFLEYLNTQDFAADSLAARGEDGETVAVHTAASAAGGEWDLVVVAGVQEDSWPDLRIRDTLLGAQQLADVATARSVRLRRDDEVEASEALRTARAEVGADELRSFVSACSRARVSVLITAVLDTDARPSVFYEMLLPHGEDGYAALPTVTPVTAGLDLRGLVGQLRAALLGPPGRAASALAVLSHLQAHGVAEADPRLWADQVEPTSTTPAFGDDAPVPVSPSAVEKAVACPLHWLLSSAGGRQQDSQAQNVGNLVHEIAATLPQGSEDQLRAELDRRWHELGLNDSWLSRFERERAEEMVRRLAGYVAANPGPVDVEAEINAEVAGAVIRGRIDRIEHTADGPRVIDLKTGASPPTNSETQAHPQLGVYQLALQALGQEPAGGALVYLGTGVRGATLRTQEALANAQDPAWAHELVAATVSTMTSAAFPARENKMCGYCQIRTSCPVQAGPRVIGEPS